MFGSSGSGQLICDQITVTGDESPVECCIKTHCCNLLIFIVLYCPLREQGAKYQKI
jgi:hypothetical protein